MKTLEISLISLSALLILSTMICGMWIHSSVANQTADSIRFHMQIGVATVIATVATLTVSFLRVIRM
jgi:hypothetical protein